MLNKTHSNILTLQFHYQYEKSFSPFHTGETSQPICVGLTFYVQKIKNERRILKESIFGILMFFCKLIVILHSKLAYCTTEDVHSYNIYISFGIIIFGI